MLLTLDIGNTNIKLALFHNNERLAFDMLDTKPIDFKSFILSFLYKANIRETQLDDCILSSVVPSLTPSIIEALEIITNKKPIVINNECHYGIEIDENVKDEVGADILVMCAYSYQQFHTELLVVSLGTATVISHITNDGKFKDCLIAPGFTSMSSAIFAKAAQLPEFVPSKHNGFLANSTLEAMNIGVYDGFIGMIRYLLNGIKVELKSNPIIIGCGGVGKDIAPYIAELQQYDPDMVTTGLNFLYNRYVKK